MRKIIGGAIVVAGLIILLNTCIAWVIGISARAQDNSFIAGWHGNQARLIQAAGELAPKT